MATPAQMKYIHNTRDREKRKRLILLVRILINYLRKEKLLMLIPQVQLIVRNCTARYRAGDVSVSPLQDAIERRLQLVINDNIWTQVILSLELYMVYRRNRNQDSLLVLGKSKSRLLATGTPSKTNCNLASV